MATIDPSLLEILACPACRSPLRLERFADTPPGADVDELACTNGECGLVYPIRDQIPVLLVDEARKPGPAGG